MGFWVYQGQFHWSSIFGLGMKKCFVNMELTVDQIGRLIECVEKRDKEDGERTETAGAAAGPDNAEKQGNLLSVCRGV